MGIFGNSAPLKVHLQGPEDRKQNSKKRKSFFVVIALIVLITHTVLGYFVYRYASQAEELRERDPLTAEEELARTIRDVGDVYELPENETPTLAEIGEEDKLPDQAFFARAKQGDRVLMYVEAKKAILWRPSTKKIIEIGPIELTQGP